jgi:hypothetical protein
MSVVLRSVDFKYFLALVFFSTETFMGEDSKNNEGEVNAVILYMPLIRFHDEYLAPLINFFLSDHVQI